LGWAADGATTSRPWRTAGSSTGRRQPPGTSLWLLTNGSWGPNFATHLPATSEPERVWLRLNGTHDNDPGPAFVLVRGRLCTVWRVKDSNLRSFRDGFTGRQPRPRDQHKQHLSADRRHASDAEAIRCSLILPPGCRPRVRAAAGGRVDVLVANRPERHLPDQSPLARIGRCTERALYSPRERRPGLAPSTMPLRPTVAPGLRVGSRVEDCHTAPRRKDV
jgi:hypothetical protein